MRKAYDFMRTNPKTGKLYKHCTAWVPDGSGESRCCQRAAGKNDHLCEMHRRVYEHNTNNNYVITLSMRDAYDRYISEKIS